MSKEVGEAQFKTGSLNTFHFEDEKGHKLKCLASY